MLNVGSSLWAMADLANTQLLGPAPSKGSGALWEASVACCACWNFRRRCLGLLNFAPAGQGLTFCLHVTTQIPRSL